MANPVAVVSPDFLAPYPVALTIVSELPFFSDGNFAVTDVNGNAIFKVENKHFFFHSRRVLLDAAGNPILSFQKKLLSFLDTWVVFRGDSSDTKDIIFSVKESSLNPFKTSLDVFLGINERKDVCDFKVKGDWFDCSCTIYAGDTTTIVAQGVGDLLIHGCEFNHRNGHEIPIPVHNNLVSEPLVMSTFSEEFVKKLEAFMTQQTQMFNDMNGAIKALTANYALMGESLAAKSRNKGSKTDKSVDVKIQMELSLEQFEVPEEVEQGQGRGRGVTLNGIGGDKWKVTLNSGFGRGKVQSPGNKGGFGRGIGKGQNSLCTFKPVLKENSIGKQHENVVIKVPNVKVGVNEEIDMEPNPKGPVIVLGDGKNTNSGSQSQMGVGHGNTITGTHFFGLILREKEHVGREIEPMSSARQYSAAGAGGKIRKHHVSRKRPSTPYDRPSQTTRSNNKTYKSQEVGVGLSKLVVNPARRLMVGVATKILPTFISKSDFSSADEYEDDPPGDHNDQEIDATDDAQGNTKHTSGLGVFKWTGGEGSSYEIDKSKGILVNVVQQDESKKSPGDHGIAKIENMRKGKQFSRDERNRLLEILNSRFVDIFNTEEETKTPPVNSGGTPSETVRKIREKPDRHNHTPKEKAGGLKIATQWKRTPSDYNTNLMPNGSSVFGNFIRGYSSENRSFITKFDGFVSLKGMVEPMNSSHVSTGYLGAGPSFSFKNIGGADEKSTFSTIKGKDISQLGSIDNQINRHDLTKNVILKPHLGPTPVTDLQPVLEGRTLLTSLSELDTRKPNVKTELLVVWDPGGGENATWKNLVVFGESYLDFELEDKLNVEEGSNDMDAKYGQIYHQRWNKGLEEKEDIFIFESLSYFQLDSNSFLNVLVG